MDLTFCSFLLLCGYTETSWIARQQTTEMHTTSNMTSTEPGDATTRRFNAKTLFSFSETGIIQVGETSRNLRARELGDLYQGSLPVLKRQKTQRAYINLEQRMRNLTRNTGARASFYCDILGQPIPLFQWFKNGEIISGELERFHIETGLWGSLLRIEEIKKSDEGNYVCMATNPSGELNATAHLRVVQNGIAEQHIPKNIDEQTHLHPNPSGYGFCQEFHSSVCGKYLSGHQVYVTTEYQQAMVETQISKFLKLLAFQRSNRVEKKCLKSLMQVICYYNFPICAKLQKQNVANSVKDTQEAELEPESIKLCRSDCFRFMNSDCGPTYIFLNETIAQEVPEVLPDCSNLPNQNRFVRIPCRSINQTDGKSIAGKMSENAHKSDSYRHGGIGGKQEPNTLSAVVTTPPDLVPLFISGGVLILLGSIFLTACFLCRQGKGNSLIPDGHGAILAAKHPNRFSFFSGTNDISLIGQRDCLNPAIPELNGQTCMSEQMITRTRGRFYHLQDDGYTVAYGPGSHLFLQQLKSSRNANLSLDECSISTDPESQLITLNDNRKSSDNLNVVKTPTPNNGSPACYYQYQRPTYNKLSPSDELSPFQSEFKNPDHIDGVIVHSTPVTSTPGFMDVPLQQRIVGSLSNPRPTTSRGQAAVGCTLAESDSNRSIHVVQSDDPPIMRCCIPNFQQNDETPGTFRFPPQSVLTEYPIDRIRFGKEFGRGVFGPVYKAELLTENSPMGISPKNVIVKTLSTAASDLLYSDFLREARLIAELDHPNILSILGVNLLNPPWCMIFEVPEYTDLSDLLRNNRPEAPKQCEAPFSDRTRLHILGQVAAGMVYLSNHLFVHRDLAARNILVLHPGMLCKITDLGLALDCYAPDYYRMPPHKLMLPIRWMPMETILFGKFTVHSDVWAFGVLIWEIWSRGIRPYSNYSDEEVLELLKMRRLLPKPENCPNEIYDFLLSCWSQNQNDRPCFKDCMDQITQWRFNIDTSGTLQATCAQFNVVIPRVTLNDDLTRKRPVMLDSTNDSSLNTSDSEHSKNYVGRVEPLDNH